MAWAWFQEAGSSQLVKVTNFLSIVAAVTNNPAGRKCMLTRLAAGAIALIAVAGAAEAQDWPAKKNVRVIVPFTAGSSTDIAARVVFEQVGKQVSQTFVVENRGGGGTTIGSNAVAKSEPDGYTLLVNSTSHVAVAATYRKTPYDPVADFAGITPIANLPLVIIAPLKYKTMSDLVKAGGTGALNFGSAGAGSSGHLFLERFRLKAGIKAAHVPFRGTPEGVTEIIAGRIDFYVAPVLNAVPFVRDRKISALAVGTQARTPTLPDIPTLAEAGVKDAGYDFWVGALAPAKTPRPVIDRIHDEMIKAMKMADVVRRIENLGASTMPMKPAEFDAFLREQVKLHKEIVAASGFKPQ
jgi:tripartite-type tricarboxylate transporter receptor subunit TctC